MLDVFSEPVQVALVGLIGGILLGLAARIGRFCTLGAIEDLSFMAKTLFVCGCGESPLVSPSSGRLLCPPAGCSIYNKHFISPEVGTLWPISSEDWCLATEWP